MPRRSNRLVKINRNRSLRNHSRANRHERVDAAKRTVGPRIERLENRLVFSVAPLAGVDPGESVVFSSADQLELRGPEQEYAKISHSKAFALADGSIGIEFTAKDIGKQQALFSKDARGFGGGGHLTALVKDGYVEVRLQSIDRSETVRSAHGSIVAGETYKVVVTFGEAGFNLFVDGDQVDSEHEFTQGIVGNEETLAIGANIWARSDRDPDWAGDFFQGTLTDFVVYDRALTRAEVVFLAGPGNPDDGSTLGTSESGLDQIVDLIHDDPRLNRRIPLEEIYSGAEAADKMNGLIIKAIQATGVANDGRLDAADLRDVNAHLRLENAEQWIVLHGDDESGSETGFHLVQGDGATTHVFGDSNLVNTVADGIYHLGFGIEGRRLLNEDGNRNASLEDVAFWLNEFLAEDFQEGLWRNDNVDLTVTPSTKTGLDSLVTTIATDPGLIHNIPTSEIVAGARAGDRMNVLIKKAIEATGVVNDGNFSAADVRDVNAHLRENHLKEWIVLHGDDEDGEETGFHFVQGDGATTHVFGDSNAVNTVADGIFHLGFGTRGNRIANEDGNANASFEDLAHWLNELLADDLLRGNLTNSNVDLTLTGSTRTGLDTLITTIANDPGLNLRVPTSEIVQGGRAGDEMNHLIIEAIQATGVAYDHVLDTADIRLINGYLRDNHLAQWVKSHGDDEGDSETGFHLVQNDGAKSQMFGDENAVNTVADGIFHLGFSISGNRLLNEDGNRNASLEDVAYWLNELLAEDFATGILVDPNAVPSRDAIDASLVYEKNEIDIDLTGFAEVPNAEPFKLNGGTITISFSLDSVDGRQTLLSKDHRGYQTGGHLTARVVGDHVEVRLQNDSQSKTIRTRYGSVVPGREHQLAISFGEQGGFRVSLDGNLEGVDAEFDTGIANNSNSIVFGASTAYRNGDRANLRDFFQGDLSNFAVYNRELSVLEVSLLADSRGTTDEPMATAGTSDSGLDGLVDLILADPGLRRRLPQSEIIAGAEAADAMNDLIVKAIRATGVANDASLDAADVRDINAYLHANHRDAWVELHGDDEGDSETGFHFVQNDGAKTHLFGDSNAVNTVADGIYHLGFGIQRDRLLNEDGNRNATIKDVAFWLTEFLEEDLRQGSLAGGQVDLTVEATSDSGLDSLISIIENDAGLLSRIPTSERVTGMRAANEMNRLIVDAIKATGVAADAVFTPGDVRDINAYLQTNHADLWVEQHGDDEGDSETGFHLVQNDGALTHLFGDDNAVNTIADGLYHLGFSIKGDRLLNEDGNRNASLEDVAYWLNELLADDLLDGTLVESPDKSVGDSTVNLSVTPSSSSGLDSLTNTILTDYGLNLRVRTSEIVEAARSADEMNNLIIEAISATGAANDGMFDVADVYDVNRYLRDNHQERWIVLHGDDEDGEGQEETGFHLVQGDGARAHLFGDENAVNTVADGVYHLGLGISGGRLLNEDGNRNASLEDVAFWLNELLAEDLAAGTLVNEALLPNEASIADAVVTEMADVLETGKTMTHVELDHQNAFLLKEGTMAVTLNADTVDGRQTLFSKDHRGYQDGGHLTASIVNGRLEVRLQSESESRIIKSSQGAIVAGQLHRVAVSFGQDGFRVFLDGELVGAETDFTVGIDDNTNSIVLGATTARRSGDHLNLSDYFDGVLQDFTISTPAAETIEIPDAPQELITTDVDSALTALGGHVG